MRSLDLGLAVALLGALAAAAPHFAVAQKSDSAALSVGSGKAAIVREVDSTVVAQSTAPVLAGTPRAPYRDSLTIGGRVIKAGERVEGPIVVAGGDLEVRGTVLGSAIAIAGDVIVKDGGSVSGDAIAAFGDVRREGGTIGGVARSMTGIWGENLRSGMRGEGFVATKRSPLSLAFGWFGVMLLIGLGVLVFASNYLDGVVDVLQESFWRSFLVGIAGELGVLPAMVLLIVALAVTIIGVLLIPFAVVAFVLAIAGLATLGFIAVARVTGEGFASRSAQRLTPRGGALRAVLLGVTLYMGIWILATAVGGVPAVGLTLRILGILVTYVALTAGFGASILSRAGTRRDGALLAVPAPAMDSAAWQTPTPVTGVVAARRPTTRKAESTLK
jgi:hypothetical protein